MDQERKFRGAGGTPGGVGEFLFGLGMTVAGGYLLMKQVTVASGYWQIGGYNAFGLSLLPLLVGIGLLFFDGRSLIGKLLTFGGAVIILIGIIANLNIYFQPTSLFNTIIILALIAGGIGLIARAVREH
jgi:multisubunit Na+/H+ antiporter MnhF subunit